MTRLERLASPPRVREGEVGGTGEWMGNPATALQAWAERTGRTGRPDQPAGAPGPAPAVS